MSLPPSRRELRCCFRVGCCFLGSLIVASRAQPGRYTGLKSLCHNTKLHQLCFKLKLVISYWRASVASETLTGVTQSKIGDVCWRASVASETVLGVDNAKSGICYRYICMWDGTYAP